MGVPIPEAEAGDDRIPAAIQLAVEEAGQKGVVGKDITPYILSRCKNRAL